MCEKPYYHLTVKAFFDQYNSDAAEWAWVTLKKVYGNIVAPEDSRFEHLTGAGMPHWYLAFVRGAAWRAAYRCNIITEGDGGYYFFWEESVSESVFATGQFIGQQPDIFEFKFTNSPIPLEDGSMLDPMAGTHVFAPTPLADEHILEPFEVLPINYIDPLKHHRWNPRRPPELRTRYGDTWYAQQYVSALNFLPFHGEFPEGEDEVFDQCLDIQTPIPCFGSPNLHCVYEAIRSSSREHPHWMLHGM
jgi:hypothetical protein